MLVGEVLRQPHRKIIVEVLLFITFVELITGLYLLLFSSLVDDYE